MGLNRKITLFFVTGAVLMMGILTLVSVLTTRHLLFTTAEEQARMGAELVRVYLTDSMVHSTAEATTRNSLKARFAGVESIRDAYLVRGPSVSKQYGEKVDEKLYRDDIDEIVLESAEPYLTLVSNVDEMQFRATIPFLANARSNPNCLSCHEVQDGGVLGAISFSISVAEQQNRAMLAIAFMVGAFALFAVFSILFFRRQTRPFLQTALEIRDAVGRATRGQFSASLTPRTNDEVGQIAIDFTNLMAFLKDGLTQISDAVGRLLRYQLPADGNLLATTTETVHALISAAEFKQAIEEDETKAEVYSRLAIVLKDEFFQRWFTVYEVEKERMVPVVVDGELNRDLKWCDQQVLVRADACRARRTGHIIDSIQQEHICGAFCPGNREEPVGHICIPILESGSVSGVVQLVILRSEPELTQKLLPFIQFYLWEAAPVIETKRLTDRLRDSSLRDPMTGLHNRRFLEQYVETLVAEHRRRQTSFCILMLDLDYFKKVNDAHGHEAGDIVIKELALALRHSVRTADLVIRYGGEEFLIVLQDTESRTGDEVAEKIRAVVEAMKMKVQGAVLQKTISIGVAEFPADSDSFWQTAKFADVALYKAKEGGRNRVVHFKADMWSDLEEY